MTLTRTLNFIRGALFILGLSTSLGAIAQSSQTAPAANSPAAQPPASNSARDTGKPAAPKVEATPALWEIKGPHATLYFFGTFHLLKPNVDWHTAKVKAALDASQALLEEIADVDQQSNAAQPLIQQLGMDQEHPLSTKISKDDLDRLDAAVKQIGLPGEAALEPMRPWVASIMLSVLPMMKSGYDMNSGADIVLTKEFRAKNKPIEGLETVEQQLHFLSDMTTAQEVESLHVQLQKLDGATKELEDTMAAWERGDDETIARVENDSFRKDYPDVYNQLIVKRNKTWADKLAAMLQGNRITFVAVGAGHMAGPDSVLSMLEARGYKVTRL